MRMLSRPAVLLVVALLVGACSSAATPSPAAPTSAAPSASPSAAASTVAPTASESPSASANPCSKDNLKTLAAGKLTVGTDNPAYPPYFEPPASGNAPKPWELGDPTNGQGFESAVAYAVADKLGFTKDEVTWTVVPFDNSYKPGAKPFDFYLAQVSYTPERAQAVDMSDGYYFVAQSIVALSSNPITKVTSISGLKGYKFGAQRGTTAYDAIQSVIQPTKPVAVYNSNDLAIQAAKAKQVDAIVTDLPTAFFITGSGQLANSVIVGQLPVQQGANAEHFSLVLAKGSSLTPCVNQAIAALKSDGTLDKITTEWLAGKSAPVLQP